MDVEIVVDAVAHDPVQVQARGVARVDLFAVHHELRFPALHLNAQLVRRPAARVGFGHRVARRPFDDGGGTARVARATTDRVHAVDGAYQEVGVDLAGI